MKKKKEDRIRGIKKYSKEPSNKPSPTPIKYIRVSAYNRLQAISNSPIYQKLYKSYTETNDLVEKLKIIKKIRKRFGLPNDLINPEEIKNLTLSNCSHCFDKIKLKARSLFKTIPIMPMSVADVRSLSENLPRYGYLIQEPILFLKVDLSYRQSDLRKKFNDYLKNLPS